MARLNFRGCIVEKSYLDRHAQEEMVDAIRDLTKSAPLFSPLTPWGKPMKVRMTSAGKYGWYSDRRGYRYESVHPDGGPWPSPFVINSPSSS